MPSALKRAGITAGNNGSKCCCLDIRRVPRPAFPVTTFTCTCLVCGEAVSGDEDAMTGGKTRRRTDKRTISLAPSLPLRFTPKE